MNAPLPKLYTSADAALFLGVKVCTVRNECYRGHLGFVTIGGRFVRHTEEHLASYVRRREVVARANFGVARSGGLAAGATQDHEPLKFESPHCPRNERQAINQAASALARHTFTKKPLPRKSKTRRAA